MSAETRPVPAPAPAAPAISLRRLTKVYGDLRAVDDLSLDVPVGSFFGVVGPNGAGKTTTLSMATGLLRPDAGSAAVLGHQLWADGTSGADELVAGKALLGVLPDGLRLYDRLTGAELVRYAGLLHGLSRPVARERAGELLEALDLTGAAGKLVVDGWYTAGAIPWTAWLVPLLMWGSFIFVSYIMLACLGVMLRAQWAEREALAFPLLRLPLELTEDVDRTDQLGVIGRFFRNPLMWVGFGIGVFIQLLKGLHVYFADVPDVPLEIATGSLFTEAPWNQIGWTPMQLYPIAIGITYLLTSEISFSLWFFYWFMRLQLMIAFTLGFLPNTLPALVGHTAGARAFIGYQQIGAYLAYVALVLWTGREHFGHVARRAFGRERARESEKREALSYPLAFWGFVFAFVFMIAWSCAAGISLGIALAMWSLYLVIAIALTRLVVEGGLLFVQQAWTPLGAIAQITGSGPGTILPASSIVPASFLQGAIITDLRAFLLPSFVQSFKLAHDRKIKARPLLALIMTCVLITLVMGIWMNVRMGYEKGGLSLDPWFAQGGAQTPANTSNDLIKGARDVSHWNLIWLAVGGLLTFGMMFARTRFLWFPLHPLGFLMSVTYPMNRLWFSVFLGWLAKVTIQRFGGSDTYRRLVAAFLGLALGDVAMMIFWLLIDAWQIRMGHNLMPT